ncbi:MAG TPA: Rrf2 family transcriptional regulator [Nitrospiraceae bacterium]|nr:Rrf2 family transcriptional regulator [Nitrospiraceae bacterium]
MKVSLKATYGILAALDLALNNGTLPVQSKAIAKRQAIPIRFLEQVLLAMKKAGIVDSLRGVQGGYILRKPAADISLAEIVEALDGSLMPKPVHATGTRHTQGRSRPEQLLGAIWERVRQAELDVLNAVTLRELAERHQQFEQQRALMYHI